MSDISKLTLLGNQEATYRYESPNAESLEVFENAHSTNPYVIGLESNEFTSLCPMTGQPDYGKISIHYVPDQLCVESKSLKFYLVSYRNHGAFHEDCVNRIADDLTTRLSPWYLRVFGDFNPRGGIAIKPLAIRRHSSLTPKAEAHLLTLFVHYDSVN